ncbi:MAG: FprA family A-type flavoprotein [Myxococcales bacterium]|nr:FprA family A-type flavoprotein [Myxococcales bacterium]
MPNTILFESGDHRNILLEDFATGDLAVQANQHVIVAGGEGMILDPGGHKVYNKVLSETTSLLRGANLRYLFLSHQDPDIVAAVNGWLMTTDADAYVSALWTRFVPHFGLDHLVADRLHAIPDEGMVLELGGVDLLVLPAHFLHACGNFHLYDPVAKTLYSGDLGASLGMPYIMVPDFDAHLQYMAGFHKRYMVSNAALRPWVKMVRQLEIDVIAPQHGAQFKGKEICSRFLDWCEDLACGVDLMADIYKIPSKG